MFSKWYRNDKCNYILVIYGSCTTVPRRGGGGVDVLPVNILVDAISILMITIYFLKLNVSSVTRITKEPPAESPKTAISSDFFAIFRRIRHFFNHLISTFFSKIIPYICIFLMKSNIYEILHIHFVHKHKGLCIDKGWFNQIWLRLPGRVWFALNIKILNLIIIGLLCILGWRYSDNKP